VKAALGIAEQAARDLIIAGSQLGGQFLGHAGRDVLPFGDDHHAVENLPLERMGAGVANGKRHGAARNGQVVRFARRGRDIHRDPRRRGDGALAGDQYTAAVAANEILRTQNLGGSRFCKLRNDASQTTSALEFSCESDFISRNSIERARRDSG
jgi:hypothetical protein